MIRKAMNFIALALTLFVISISSPPFALAHHSFESEYDSNKPITLIGSVTKFE